MVDSPSSSSDSGAIGRLESIRALLDFVRDAGLLDEQERQRHLDTKAGTLAGLIAVALSLEAALGASVLFGDELGCAARALFVTAFLVAIVGLALSALLALAVLVPQAYPALSDGILKEFATRRQMDVDETTLLGRQLSTVVEVTLQTRERNGRKARSLRWSAYALAVAIMAIASQGLTLPFA